MSLMVDVSVQANCTTSLWSHRRVRQKLARSRLLEQNASLVTWAMRGLLHDTQDALRRLLEICPDEASDVAMETTNFDECLACTDSVGDDIHEMESYLEDSQTHIRDTLECLERIACAPVRPSCGDEVQLTVSLENRDDGASKVVSNSVSFGVDDPILEHCFGKVMAKSMATAMRTMLFYEERSYSFNDEGLHPVSGESRFVMSLSIVPLSSEYPTMVAASLHSCPLTLEPDIPEGPAPFKMARLTKRGMAQPRRRKK